MIIEDGQNLSLKLSINELHKISDALSTRLSEDDTVKEMLTQSFGPKI
ncbi:MAG: hypothetical protein WCC17_22300 [Candidatus Nitrosopolaris sp.]